MMSWVTSGDRQRYFFVVVVVVVVIKKGENEHILYVYL